MKFPNSIISVATILHNDEAILESYLMETGQVLQQCCEKYEIVLIDNGSTDRTGALIQTLQKQMVNIRLLTLSRHYDEEHARIAALDHCIGDIVVLMDVNFDPPSVIPAMLKQMNGGYDIVIGERTNRNDERFVDRAAAKAFYRISQWLTGFRIDPNQTDFVALSRKTVNSLVQIRDRSRYLKYLKLEVGYKRTTVKYDRIQRNREKKRRGILESFGFAVEMIFTNSDKLLRTVSLLALFVSMINLVYVIYVLLVALFKRNVAEGWTTTSLVNASMFGLLFIILSIIGVYISSILKETKKGPLYYVTDESNSSMIYQNVEKKNIV
ncbi:glycosyltransferase family 2 protein [Cohnella candidum]|uniref:Glycosyltransferase n=1 Tax=Cohnella candidum TaxID=2674991 RepID=A0A3G3K134_9BACL|nr:glycosyltransferase family 2 protein [Cohnella candidum]AYQ74163.1 glycosyltransferase [Cohnella candidum]